MHNATKGWLLGVMSGLVVACDTGNNFAPVIDANGHRISPPPSKRLVQPPKPMPAISATTTAQKIEPIWRPIMTSPQKPRVIVTENQTGWRWPVKGRIITPFSDFNKGVNIAGYLGEPIYAAASGKVVYSGNGLPGYGNLIILEHANLYFTAYAHADQLLVRSGEVVKKGQQIAEMGKTGSDRVMLHFEIRKQSKPIDPMRFLKMI